MKRAPWKVTAGLAPIPDPTDPPILPHLGGMRAYEPPEGPDGAPLPTQQPPIQGITDESEAWTTQPPIPWPWPMTDTDLDSGISGVEVYKTQGFWKALDVYFSTTPPPRGGAGALSDPLAGGTLSVFVYTFTLSGSRILVASGRFRSPLASPASTAFFAIPQHICSVRQALAQRYEVRVNFSLGGAIPVRNQPLTITVVGSNDTTERDESVGVITAAQLAAPSIVFNPVAPFIALPELVGVEAVNNSAPAAPRFLLYWDFAGVPGAVAPVFSWPLGDAAGDGIVKELRGRRSFAFQLRPSSTPLVLTAQVDCAVQALIR